jgi:hypothetical protein
VAKAEGPGVAAGSGPRTSRRQLATAEAPPAWLCQTQCRGEGLLVESEGVNEMVGRRMPGVSEMVGRRMPGTRWCLLQRSCR